MRALTRARTSAVTVASTFNPIPNRSTVILLNPTVINQQVLTHNMHRAKAAGIQVLAIFRDTLHDKEWQAVARRKRCRWQRRMQSAHYNSDSKGRREQGGENEKQTTDKPSRAQYMKGRILKTIIFDINSLLILTALTSRNDCAGAKRN